MSLSYREVAEILKIIDASDCDEVVLELEGMRLVVRRGAANGAAYGSAPQPVPSLSAPAPVALQAPASAPAAITASPAQSVPASAPLAAGQLEIRAPMVGTFYRRPSPQDPVFVEVGSTVTKGQALCLIEVMKLFTTIEAQQAGVIEMIGAQDGALVEFDQLLFRIKPT